MGWEARSWELGSLVEKQAYRKTLGKGLLRRAPFIKVAIIIGGQRNGDSVLGIWLSFYLILIHLNVNELGRAEQEETIKIVAYEKNLCLIKVGKIKKCKCRRCS